MATTISGEQFLPSFSQEFNVTDTKYYDGSTFLLMTYIIQHFSFLQGFKPNKLPKRVSYELGDDQSLNFEALLATNQTVKFKVSRQAEGIAPGLEHGTYVFSYPLSGPNDFEKDFYYSDTIIGFPVVLSGAISFNNQGVYTLKLHLKLDAPGGINLINQDVNVSDSVNKDVCFDKGLGWIASAKLCLKIQYPCLHLRGELSAFGKSTSFEKQITCF